MYNSVYTKLCDFQNIDMHARTKDSDITVEETCVTILFYYIQLLFHIVFHIGGF